MKKVLFVCAFLFLIDISADWGEIGSEISGIGESVGGFMVTMGQGIAGTVPSGYDYSFRVFNGSNVGMFVDIHKSISVMGARYHQGGGASQSLAPGEDTGTGFSGQNSTHLYFSLEISGGGSSYSDPHFTLGAKNDPTIYYYHCFNASDSGAPAVELLGAGYTVSSAFSGRIQNKTSQPASVTYTLNGPDTRVITIPDLDPLSFNYLNIPQGYSIRPSHLVFGTSQKVIIPAVGIAQVSDPKKNSSTPVTMNYVLLNDSPTGAFETGVGPGYFEQPQTPTVIRDITPVQCQIYNQPANQAAQIGQLLAQPLPWQSVWCAYQGYGWSQAQQKIIETPMWQIPAGANDSCFLIRPSQTAFAKNGPARFFMVRMTVPEQPSATDIQNAQAFLSKLMTGKLTIKGLSPAVGGPLITQANGGSVTLVNGQYFSSQTSFSAGQPFVSYPPLSDTYLGSTISLSSLTVSKKAELLGLELPDTVGMLEDPTTGVQGYLLVSDVFTPYGEGGGPVFYLINPPYLDLSQMLGTLSNYASLCNYQSLTSDIFNQLVQSFLPQTVQQWVQGYLRNPAQVEDSIASFVVLLGKGDVNKLTQAFTASSSFYVEAGAQKQLSPQGNALLKMLLYGPCSVSQAPIYHKTGSSFMSAQSGWPAVSLNL
jgi:hypothetical protein